MQNLACFVSPTDSKQDGNSAQLENPPESSLAGQRGCSVGSCIQPGRICGEILILPVARDTGSYHCCCRRHSPIWLLIDGPSPWLLLVILLKGPGLYTVRQFACTERVRAQ